MSVPFDLADVVAWTGGKAATGLGDRIFRGARIDSRAVAQDDLFVAIRGEHHDAHAFLTQAVANGAGGLVVDEEFVASGPIEMAVPMVVVEDTTRALGDLAAGHRALFEGILIAITGSNGKTTTKDMCHAIMATREPSLKTEGNLNNEFGLPLTLLSREPEHTSAVIELGMNHRGEIARLTAIARPDVGVLTNVGTAHIEFLGSRETIALEKGDLVAGLGPDGIAVLNADDPFVESQAERVEGQILRFGRGRTADVSVQNDRFDDGSYAFTLCTPEGEVAVRVAGLADTTIINALAASAAALAAGASLEQIAEGLARFEAVAGRMLCRRLVGGARVVDDTYNANPQSVRSALESLARLMGEGRGIAVLGDMGELGESAAAAHRDAGRLAARLGLDLLIAIGEYAEDVIAGARGAGMDVERAFVGKDQAGAASTIGSQLQPEDWVLVKGSRAMRMERVVEALLGEGTA